MKTNRILIVPPQTIDTRIVLNPITLKAKKGNLRRETRFISIQQMVDLSPIRDTLIVKALINKIMKCKMNLTLTLIIRAPKTERAPGRLTSVGLEAIIQISETVENLNLTPETLPTRVPIKVISKDRMLEVPQAKKHLLNLSFGTQLTIGSLTIKGSQTRKSQKIKGNQTRISMTIKGYRTRISLTIKGNRTRISLKLKGYRTRISLTIKRNRTRISLIVKGYRTRSSLTIKGNRTRISLTVKGYRTRSSLTIKGNRT